MGEPSAVVFDLDGVLIESERVWDTARQEVVRDRGGTWHDSATTDMMGMSSKEWSSYMHDRLGVPMEPAEINDAVVERAASAYEAHLPLLPHAAETVRELATRWSLGVASSSNRPIIELVLERAGVRACFGAIVSSEEVERGKPAPDVYLEATRRMEVDPMCTAAVEDSTNGLLAARAAGMRVIAIPNDAHPPAEEGLEAADVVLHSIEELNKGVVVG